MGSALVESGGLQQAESSPLKGQHNKQSEQIERGASSLKNGGGGGKEHMRGRICSSQSMAGRPLEEQSSWQDPFPNADPSAHQQGPPAGSSAEPRLLN